jgi:hypothetical protein
MADSWIVGMDRAWLSDVGGFEKRWRGDGRLKAQVVVMMAEKMGGSCELW